MKNDFDYGTFFFGVAIGLLLFGACVVMIQWMAHFGLITLNCQV